MDVLFETGLLEPLNVKKKSNMSTKYVYSPADTIALRALACSKGKVRKLRPNEQEAILHQYESYKREAKRFGFSALEAEAGFGALMGQTCAKKIPDVPWANTELAQKRYIAIEKAAGRRENLGLSRQDNAYDVHTPKISDVKKVMKSICPDNNPTKSAVKNGEMFLHKFLTNSIHQIQKAKSNEIAKKHENIKNIQSRAEAAIYKQEAQLSSIKSKYEQKTDKFKAMVNNSIANICKKQTKEAASSEKAPF